MKLNTISSIDGHSEAFIYSDGKSVKIYIADLNKTEKTVSIFFFKNINSEIVNVEEMLEKLPWLKERSGFGPYNFEFVGESYITDEEILSILYSGFESFDYVERTISRELSKPWQVEGLEKYN